MISICESEFLNESLVGWALRSLSKLPGISHGLSAVKATTPFQKASGAVNSAREAIQGTGVYQKSAEFLNNHPYAKAFVGGATPGNIADTAVFTVGMHKAFGPGQQPPEITMRQEYESDQPFRAPLQMLRNYSQFTDEHPVLGYGAPILGVGALLGAGAVGKKIFSSSNQQPSQTGRTY